MTIRQRTRAEIGFLIFLDTGAAMVRHIAILLTAAVSTQTMARIRWLMVILMHAHAHFMVAPHKNTDCCEQESICYEEKVILFRILIIVPCTNIALIMVNFIL